MMGNLLQMQDEDHSEAPAWGVKPKLNGVGGW